MKIGAHYLGDEACEFTVWAPFLTDVTLKIASPNERLLPMNKDDWGYWRAAAENISPETRYSYRLNDEKERPDPASHFQPDGVHSPSQVIDHGNFKWEDSDWRGVPLQQMILYELHVGTFTSQATFEAIIPRLNDLVELGITAVELMPVAQFPGERNWGYDGVYPFAAQNSYGGPAGLKKLVNACHQRGLSVVLDVVYNHLGPEGNYLRDFGPYFTGKYQTPWGEAVNFDDEYSDEVRNYFIENALHWFDTYHIDALRLDAIHAIYDMSAKPFLQELAERVEEFSNKQGRKFYLIAESALNDTRIIRPRESGGFGLDAQWNDDFHHSLRTVLTDEREGYYIDFGDFEQFTKVFKEGFAYSWQYSEYRKRHHGNSAVDRPAQQFVVFTQNHDHVGNRMLGERLSTLVSLEVQKLAAGAMLLSPYLPLLFMGEEYAEESPFLYFISHSDPDLVQAVREGRKAEFKEFQWQGEPPDAQSVDTFLSSQLKWETRVEGKHKVLLDFYKTLIKLRKEIPALAHLDKKPLKVITEKNEVLAFHRWHETSAVFCIMNFNDTERIEQSSEIPKGTWTKKLDSSDQIWLGAGPVSPEQISKGQKIVLQPSSFALYIKEDS
ncbi:malto-oligosyltrehalose trehalohydrolase [candidate division KSB1 bacterium]|nr:malto-oligosyltrehalose trehalohydrolase [candidate division KSB1 bacterium]NIR72232.1 malto-oligosyltrehalose trehalohydrolase [candidate division KSB1 bacterium]NIS26298.1 malto-oligosyltrehalose trehalohydrolase [candidate division KSB1 bacterium]NIT73061.1 malto-oligosyltrehalose trehalohydrolase [candidate division KSB1 bacterium]NIU26968.1 malto-oligosyltrehalose trehalohydrolase [candidate division KSB1 bacterium]